MKRLTAVIVFALAAHLTMSYAQAGERPYSIEGQVTGDVYFDTFSAALDEPAMAELDKLCDWLREHPGSTVLLAGYDDQRTHADRSIELGWERANAVRDYLVSQGIYAAGVKAISFGNTKGTQPGSGEAVWSKERRVRYRVLPPEGEVTMEGKPGGVCQKCKK